MRVTSPLRASYSLSEAPAGLLPLRRFPWPLLRRYSRLQSLGEPFQSSALKRGYIFYKKTNL